MSKNRRLVTRRHALQLGLASLVGVGASVTVEAMRQNYQAQQNQALDNPRRNFTVVGQNSLKKRAAAKGLIYGAATEQVKLSSDIAFATHYVQECGILVTENQLKWIILRPTPDRFDFTPGDWLAEFARTHGMLFRGHTLVWEQVLPKWFGEVVNRQNAEKILVEHITEVVKHYSGKVHSWDVVNEAIAVSYSNRPDGLSLNPWMLFLGESYIDLAFRTAAAADPHTMLVYNDRWLDYDTPRDNAQRIAVLKLLERLKTSGTPLHALGIQAHLNASETRFNPKKLRKFLADVASLGLKILVTELDVIDKDLPKDIKVRDRIVASVYEDYLNVVLDEKAVIAVLTWGLSDRYTWLATYEPRKDRAPVRTLPLDSNLKPKLAWNAMARAFDNAPKR
ncbi:endo-1,4-beta-xylanase [Brasilonema sp. UFV-L1]|uniref:endo-1,4-beta-xylanase n=1 Tax=Brasilonema sp. UFV-L1 TaxID=2234130 RepID=UPI00145F0475|nr:endo-1,4-beta-xylanase [Brasilonema sp. UFV-L1]NMG06341.1 glycosyl hydrolase family 10 [Brasilonema sp. UFV-L1]